MEYFIASTREASETLLLYAGAGSAISSGGLIYGFVLTLFVMCEPQHPARGTITLFKKNLRIVFTSPLEHVSFHELCFMHHGQFDFPK